MPRLLTAPAESLQRFEFAWRLSGAAIASGKTPEIHASPDAQEIATARLFLLISVVNTEVRLALGSAANRGESEEAAIADEVMSALVDTALENVMASRRFDETEVAHLVRPKVAEVLSLRRRD